MKDTLPSASRVARSCCFSVSERLESGCDRPPSFAMAAREATVGQSAVLLSVSILGGRTDCTSCIMRKSNGLLFVLEFFVLLLVLLAFERST